MFPRTALLALALLLVGLFVMRTYYGLSLELRTGDDVQVYLLGLKFFTTGRWPFFGPDVFHETQTQLPGALQGLLVGVPLVLTRQPEAPLILLNMLSFMGVLSLALYLARRFALMSAWLTGVCRVRIPHRWPEGIAVGRGDPGLQHRLSDRPGGGAAHERSVDRAASDRLARHPAARLPDPGRAAVSRSLLMRRIDATVGDFLDKPVSHGGLALSRPLASAVIAVIVVACIHFLPQQPGSHPVRSARSS